MYVSNVTKAVSLYQPLLNANLLYQRNTEGLLETPKIRLKVSTSDTRLPQESIPVHVTVEDIGDTAKFLFQNGAKMREPKNILPALGDSYLYFTDPDGNLIELFGPNKDHSHDEELKKLLADQNKPS